MGFLRELRTSLENPQTPLSMPAEWLIDMLTGGRTDSGARVLELTALQVSTVFACVELISGILGSLDLNVYERVLTANKHIQKRVAYEHDLFDLLEFEPNEEMTAYTFKKTIQAHRLLWGNGYSEIQRDQANRAVALWPRNPARTHPYRAGSPTKIGNETIPPGELFFKTTEGMDEISTPDTTLVKFAAERNIAAADMLHFPGLALDGRVGQSVIQLARQAVGLAIAAEKFGAKLFANGAKPGGILSHPGVLSPEARTKLRNSWQEAQGGENAFRTAVLEEGITWHDVAIKPDEGQFLETRQHQKAELCSIFLVPPHMIGDTEKTNRANIEQIGIEFVTYTLGPHLKCWQQELKRKLFPRRGQSAGKYFAMFETRPLTMPDAETRRNFYNSGKQWGWLSTDRILELENLNPVDKAWADGYWMPINMQDAETAFAEPAQGPGPAAGGAADARSQLLGRRLVKAHLRIFRDAFGRVVARSSADSEVFRRTFLPVLLTIGATVEELAAEEMAVETPTEFEASRFLSDYIDGMQKRFDEWKNANGEADQVAERELARAVRAIVIEVYRSLATAKAKTAVLTEA